MTARRLIAYLLLNALVSAGATLAVLTVWDRTRQPAPPAAASAPAATATLPAAATPAPAGDDPTAEAAPEATQTVHVVKAGDTLGSIAQQFDVPVADIMAANGLTDPNVLQVGQSLIIPVAGSPAAATEAPVTAGPATPALLPTTVVQPPRPTATRDTSVPAPQLTIREVRSAGVLEEEVLVLVNEGGPVDLLGWSLRDETGHFYTFPSLMLFQDGAINIHTAAGSDSVTDLFWGQGQPVWGPGKTVMLSDAGGNLHTRYTVP
jgi:LysM repeat protein